MYVQSTSCVYGEVTYSRFKYHEVNMMTMFKITNKDSRIALMNVTLESHSQQTFACSKSTIGKLEIVLKYVQS